MESATTSQLRAANRRRVFHTVYSHREISKQGVSQALSMSLPTVTQNLKEIESMGLIERRGLYESTGGRKAHIYHFLARSRIALGVVLLKDLYRIAAVDLYGNTLKSKTISVSFSRTAAYFEKLGTEIQNFLQEITAAFPECRQILGVSVALQGLVSKDGSVVIYGEILGCTGLTLSEIQEYIHLPCTLIHDTEASAIAEVWFQKNKQDVALLSLNRNFGGALIINGEVRPGQELNGGIIEHMRLYPGGRPCYCGQKGCIETYCSANALQKTAGEPLETFFPSMRSGSEKRIHIWHGYLQDLAVAINNIRMLFDCDYIIGGYLHQFMTKEDFSLLTRYVDEECPFPSAHARLIPSAFTDDSAAVGAAICFIKRFLSSF